MFTTRRSTSCHPRDVVPVDVAPMLKAMVSVFSVREQQILERVRATPEGFVRTYGDVSPGAPRLAGTVLSACQDPGVPWHRIVRADGSLARGRRQRRRLEREGIPFRGERVLMRVARVPGGVVLEPAGAPARDDA
jgi:methylated-DNA-protein-cysteine methyltransferase-like protein